MFSPLIVGTKVLKWLASFTNCYTCYSICVTVLSCTCSLESATIAFSDYKKQRILYY